MIYLSTVKTSNAVVLFNGKTAIASFPASLNNTIPSLDDAEAICHNDDICKVSNSIELLVDSGKVDSKGRAIGFIVGTYTYAGTTYGYVQNARDGIAFGVGQRAKKYTSQDQALTACKAIAKDRISKIK